MIVASAKTTKYDSFRSGFSLLEIVLALAILAGALAALGEVMRLGDQNAAAAGDETQAELLAESVMSEIMVGARPLANVNGAALAVATEPPWVLSVAVATTEFKELLAVRVSVVQQLPRELQPARCELVRWLPNPEYLPVVVPQSSASTSGTDSGDQNAAGGQP
jgi:type II secretion system protein I